MSSLTPRPQKDPFAKTCALSPQSFNTISPHVQSRPVALSANRFSTDPVDGRQQIAKHSSWVQAHSTGQPQRPAADLADLADLAGRTGLKAGTRQASSGSTGCTS